MPLLIETVKAKPSIKILAILSSFSMFASSNISFNIGKIITNKTDGEINNPKIKTADKNKNVNQ